MAINANCPKCGSRDVRMSRFRGLTERIKAIFGRYPVRCRRCGERFTGEIWRAATMHYARCPRCYRMELSTWSEQYYNSTAWTTLKLRLGATPYRCEYCRCNFASFRACKERYSWRKRKTQAASLRAVLDQASEGPESL